MWVFGGQVGVALGGLLSVKILTHLLNPYEYGRFSIANTVIILISANLFGPLGQGMMRHWSIVQDQRGLAGFIHVTRKFLLQAVLLSGLLSCISGLILLVVHRQTWIVIIVLALLSGCFLGWMSVRLSILMAARKRKHVSTINVASAFAKPAVAGLLIIYWTDLADIALLGLLLVAFVSAVITEYYYKQIANQRLIQINDSGQLSAEQLGKDILSFSKPLFIWGVFAWAHQSCDRWALLTFQGEDTVGAYSVIAQLAFYPLVFASGFLSNFLVPIAYQRAGSLTSETSVSSGNNVLVGMVVIYVAGAIVLSTIFYLFHHQLVLFISNDQYAQYSYLLPMLTIAWSLYYLGQMLSGFGMLINKPTLYLRPIIISGVLATIMVFSLSIKFGVVGVTVALGLTGLFYSCWCLIIAKRLITKKQ